MKEFKTIDQQIQILKSRKLLFGNEADSRDKLIRYGYYEIVNGYKEFILNPNSKDNDEEFNPGETFEHLFALFSLDMNLQKVIMDVTKRFEMILRTALAYHISKKYGSLESDYLKRSNYKSGHRRNGIYQIDYLLDVFKKVINDNNAPFDHYRDIHGHTPAWILFKGVSLGNLKTFYQLQKSDIKEKVVRTILGIPSAIEITETAKQVFNNIIYLTHKFRNRAAHNGRIFSYHPKYNHSPFEPSFHNKIGVTKEMFNKGFGKNDLYTFVNYLSVLDEKYIYILATIGIEFYINEHLKIYPNDKTFLFENMGVPEDIISKHSNSKNIFNIL